MKSNQKILILILLVGLLALCNFFIWQEIFKMRKDVLEVIFFDIGQGDAAFIETPQGHQILIDGGPSNKILEKLSKNLPFWDRTLDLIILSHPDADHLSGLNYVLQSYKVENILWNGVKRDTKTFEYWLDNLDKEKQKQNANIIIAQKGQTIKLGRAKIYIFYPFENLQDKVFEKTSNDTSVVFKFLFGKNSFLFTGDINKKVEKGLIDHKNLLSSNLASQVLKVAHHGSKTSTSKEFLERVRPELAVISLAKNNPFKHPHQQVLKNLQEFSVKILRTDQSQDIKIISNGKDIIRIMSSNLII